MKKKLKKKIVLGREYYVLNRVRVVIRPLGSYYLVLGRR